MNKWRKCRLCQVKYTSYSFNHDIKRAEVEFVTFKTVKKKWKKKNPLILQDKGQQTCL